MYGKIVIAFIIILGYSLGIKDVYKRDQGKNRVAKVISPILILGIFIFYISSISDKIAWLFNPGFNHLEILNKHVGLVPPFLNLISWYIYLFLSLVIVILSWGLIFRRPSHRKVFLRVIPILCLMECFEINRVIDDNFGGNDMILILSLILLIVMWAAIFLFFSSNLMAKFYNQDIKFEET
jgi:hypothetical protein